MTTAEEIIENALHSEKLALRYREFVAMVERFEREGLHAGDVLPPNWMQEGEAIGLAYLRVEKGAAEIVEAARAMRRLIQRAQFRKGQDADCS